MLTENREGQWISSHWGEWIKARNGQNQVKVGWLGDEDQGFGSNICQQ
jgi:hypothetical protein